MFSKVGRKSESILRSTHNQKHDFDLGLRVRRKERWHGVKGGWKWNNTETDRPRVPDGLSEKEKVDILMVNPAWNLYPS